MTTTAIRALIQQHIELEQQQRELKARIKDVEAQLVALAPFKLGDIVPGSGSEPVFIERINVDSHDDAERYQFAFNGKKIKKDRTPHATAHAYGWVRCIPR